MKKLNRIKLRDVSDKETLDTDQLSKIVGGSSFYDGCSSGICENNRDYGSDKYCSGSATCTSGVSTCHSST